ncbi:hypothetical protein NQZ79_g8798 [Umbelopsis isabellina]|nr:hypothetical protein NQZ79_g8798 [Umbelopsis isabellina]
MQYTTVTHVVAPVKEHTHTVILLHGRDSTAMEFAEEFFESQASDDSTLPEIFPSFKWVFPDSGLRDSTRFEMSLSQWFDIWSVEEPEKRKELQRAGLNESIMFILDIINRETEIVPPSQIILGGISQGCATAIHTLMRSDTGPLWAIQSLFTSATSNSDIPNFKELYKISGSPLATPAFLSHAMDDDIVPISNGKKLYQTLDQLGMSVSWKAYKDGGHWINEPQGVDDMVGFLQSVIII